MKPTILPTALACLAPFLAGCSVLPWGSSSSDVAASSDLSRSEWFELWLTERVELARADAGLPGIAVSVIGPDLEAHVAAGFADPVNEVPMTTSTPVRIASNTKTFVACAAIRLAERGELDLDGTIGPLLPFEWTQMLEADGYRCGEITVRQLLSHTSGLFEHVRTPGFMQRIQTQSDPEWTAEEQVRLCVEGGDPVGAPGERFDYSDTGYVILGTILERTQGKPLAKVVRNELGFRSLGLDSTWWELVEEAPAKADARAHQFLADVDTHDWHPSMDLFGGGGLLSTTEDLAEFYEALFEDDVFEEHGTLSDMLTPEGLPDGSPYRLGMFADRAGGKVAWQHSGFWGTYAVRVPSLSTSIAFVVTRQDGFTRAKALVDEIVLWLADPPPPPAPEPRPQPRPVPAAVTPTSADS